MTGEQPDSLTRLKAVHADHEHQRFERYAIIHLNTRTPSRARTLTSAPHNDGGHFMKWTDREDVTARAALRRAVDS